MPNRSYTAGTQFRYGFNGKENDNDVKGTGNQQDYGMRIYDPRIGKFLSVDPLTQEYPWYTPYQFAGNDVIRNVDLDGGEPKPATTGNEVEGQSITTSEERIQGRSEINYKVSQTWFYHEGGINGSKSGWMKANDYFEDILKPIAKADNEGDFNQKLDFVFSRKDFANTDYIGMINSVGKYIKENPTYDHWSKWVPVWGSYQQAKLDFSVGKNGWGTFNSVLALSDFFLIKSLVQTPLKVMLKKGAKEGLTEYFGIGMSHEFDKSVARWKSLGLDMSGQKHHWLISQKTMKTYPVLKPFGNQTWNLTRFPNHASHMRWAHFTAYPSLGLGRIPGARLLYPLSSTPSWFKFGLLPYSGGRMLQFGVR